MLISPKVIGKNNIIREKYTIDLNEIDDMPPNEFCSRNVVINKFIENLGYKRHK
jgi:hypothetical protein